MTPAREQRLLWFERALPTPTVARLSGIPSGNAGAIQTLKIMRQLARDAVRDPAQTVRGLVVDLVPSQGWFDQIRACQTWIQENIKYLFDPTEVELVQTPQKTLEYGAGDCDDQATLLATMLDCIGHPVRFMAMGFRGEPLSHVLCQTKVASTGVDSADWACAETILPKPLGWCPAGITARYILKV